MVVSGESSSLVLRNGVTPLELLDFLRRRQQQMKANHYDTSSKDDHNDDNNDDTLWKDCMEKLQLLQDWTLYRKPRLKATVHRAREAAAAHERCVEVLLHKKRIMTSSHDDDDAGAKSCLPWSLATSTAVAVSEDGGTREEERAAVREIWGEHWQDLDRMIRLYHWFLEQGHRQQQSSSGHLHETTNEKANPLRLIRLANIAKSASTTQDEGGDERTGASSEDDEDHRCASSTTSGLLLRHELTRLGAFLKQHQRQQQQENDSGPRLSSVISSKNDGCGGDNGPNKEELAVWIRQVDRCRSATDNSSNPTVVATSETNNDDDDDNAKPPPLTAIIENARDRLRDRLEQAEAAARQSRERFEMAGAELRAQTLEHQTYVQQVENLVAVLLGKDDDNDNGAASEQKGKSGIVRILI